MGAEQRAEPERGAKSRAHLVCVPVQLRSGCGAVQIEVRLRCGAAGLRFPAISSAEREVEGSRERPREGSAQLWEREGGGGNGGSGAALGQCRWAKLGAASPRLHVRVKRFGRSLSLSDSFGIIAVGRGPTPRAVLFALPRSHGLDALYGKGGAGCWGSGGLSARHCLPYICNQLLPSQS